MDVFSFRLLGILLCAVILLSMIVAALVLFFDVPPGGADCCELALRLSLMVLSREPWIATSIVIA
jgi:hypothetical protein